MTAPDIERTIEQMREHSLRLSQRMRELTAQASDDDALVTVTCAPGGRLTDIVFDPKSRRLDTHELREVVLTAAGRAAESAQQQLTGVMNDFSAEIGMPGGDIGAELSRKMADAQKVIKEQQEKLSAMLGSLPSR